MAGGAQAPIQTSTGSAGRSARLALATRNLDVLDRDALLTLAAVTVEGFGQSREHSRELGRLFQVLMQISDYLGKPLVSGANIVRHPNFPAPARHQGTRAERPAERQRPVDEHDRQPARNHDRAVAFDFRGHARPLPGAPAAFARDPEGMAWRRRVILLVIGTPRPKDWISPRHANLAAPAGFVQLWHHDRRRSPRPAQAPRVYPNAAGRGP
jgi:hypothetical protein